MVGEWQEWPVEWEETGLNLQEKTESEEPSVPVESGLQEVRQFYRWCWAAWASVETLDCWVSQLGLLEQERVVGFEAPGGMKASVVRGWMPQQVVRGWGLKQNEALKTPPFC